MKGRKPLPTAVKRLRGTDQPVRINQNEAQAGVVVRLPPPAKWMSKLAKQVYKTKGQELINMNILGTLDIDMFLLYCVEYASYIETSEALSKFGHEKILDDDDEAVYKRLLRQNQRAWERAKAIAIEFGFTPSARARVQTIAKRDEMSEFEKLMKGL